MDQQEMIDTEGWTEERHAAFLNWMEESFVHRMFSPKSKKATGFWPSQQCSPATCRDLPLNRLIPDSATESTGDSRPRPSRLLVESGNRDLVVVASTNRSRMTKRVLSQVDASYDQVVPQLGGARDISKKKKRR
ncbi:hypothetical protein FCM35_KLT13606 [Carex littledalei]|uniref:Uncharacterized protein n=1 Tax=Carex littledalei TaxID=544730 RepID=A0A833QAD2_9POAL|nr:hypothetical protein FCM35_KLT13606 [Carex littledalei]